MVFENSCIKTILWWWCCRNFSQDCEMTLKKNGGLDFIIYFLDACDGYAWHDHSLVCKLFVSVVIIFQSNVNILVYVWTNHVSFLINPCYLYQRIFYTWFKSENNLCRFKINKGKATSLDIVLEDSRRCGTGSCLHPSNVKSCPWQPEIRQCSTRSWFWGLHHRLLPCHACRHFF